MIFFALRVILFATYCQAYENLALQRPTYEENPWPDKPIVWGAANAVDGQYSDRGEWGNQCTISANYKRTATWRVDLESVVSISHINIYYRTDNWPSPGRWFHRFAGFFLYISNTTSKDDGHLCFHEIQNVNGTPAEDQRINCSVNGRYVIFYNERKQDMTYPSYYSQYAYNDLCELEVYGCPNASYYGENCKSCPHSCQERRCDVLTGDCLGCVPGYQGPHCSHICDEYRYGLGCSFSCGYCSNGETCHHVNGTCLKGCKEGMEGEKCQKECPVGSFGVNCQENCKVFCGGNESCDAVTGICHSGCKEGWTGPLCGHVSASWNLVPAIIIPVVCVLLVLTVVIIYLLWKNKQRENITSWILNASTKVANTRETRCCEIRMTDIQNVRYPECHMSKMSDIQNEGKQNSDNQVIYQYIERKTEPDSDEFYQYC